MSQAVLLLQKALSLYEVQSEAYQSVLKEAVDLSK